MTPGLEIDAGRLKQEIGPGRDSMAAAMDRLIPAVDNLAAAGAMGLLPMVDSMAASQTAYQGSLARFEAALSRVDGFQSLSAQAQDAAISGIESAIPADFAAVLQLVYIAYYSHPEVAARIGWRSGPLQPLGFELPPFDEASLQIVRRRKPFWRQP